jgi:hypothetical protein
LPCLLSIGSIRVDVPGEHQADVFAVVAFVKQGSNKEVFYREESDLVVKRRSARADQRPFMDVLKLFGLLASRRTLLGPHVDPYSLPYEKKEKLGGGGDVNQST